MNIKFIVLIGLLVGCGTQEEEKYDWDRELQDPVHEFVQRMDANNEKLLGLKTIKLRFPVDPLNDTTRGLCVFHYDSREIYIDSTVSEADRRVIMIHELGHCLFDLKHDDRTLIMNTYIAIGRKETSRELREKYYAELDTILGRN